MFYLWGFSSAFAIYSLLSVVFPDRPVLVPVTILGDAFYEADAPGERLSDRYSVRGKAEEV